MAEITLELFLSDEVQSLLDDFASLLDVRVTFFSLTGEFLRRGKAMHNCRYCSFVQDELKCKELCVSMDCDKQREAVEKSRIIDYRCHAGLHECLAPVMVRGVVAGFVMFGQFRAGDEIPEFAAKEDELVKAFSELPDFDVDGAESLKDMINMLIGYIVDKELVSYSGSMKLQTLRYFINENFNKPVSLSQAAKFMHMSESSLTHFLRDNHHTCFKQLLIEKRISHAEKLWRDNPALSVAETAALVGYDDPHYFSRLYRKNRNRTAKSFLDSLRNR